MTEAACSGRREASWATRSVSPRPGRAAGKGFLAACRTSKLAGTGYPSQEHTMQMVGQRGTVVGATLKRNTGCARSSRRARSPRMVGTATGRSPRVQDERPDQWHRTRDTGGEGRTEEGGGAARRRGSRVGNSCDCSVYKCRGVIL